MHIGCTRVVQVLQ
jgi:hypothetical protein